MQRVFKLFVTGVGGQVGNSLVQTLRNIGEITSSDIDITMLTSPSIGLDLTDHGAIKKTLEEVKPSIIVNPAAFTSVDKAESQKELSKAINQEAVKIIAQYCFEHNVPLIHYSTDYVFPGHGTKPWVETDIPDPINFYGLSKLEGERAIQKSGCPYVILRTSWVFSDFGHNFVKTMLRLGETKSELKVVADQVGAPTSADFIAENTALVIQKGIEEGFESISGIYHLCNEGETSWYEFSKEIFYLAKLKGKRLALANVYPLSTSDYPTPAKRPLNSRLNCEKFKKTFNTGNLENWQAALNKVLEKLKARNFVL